MPLYVRSVIRPDAQDPDDPASYNYFATTYQQVVSLAQNPFRLTVHVTGDFNASGIVISPHLVLTADHVFKTQGTPRTGVAEAERGKINGTAAEIIAADIIHGTIRNGQTVQTTASWCATSTATARSTT
jgi:hypothetical protein